jgi:hypothetical protein
MRPVPGSIPRKIPKTPAPTPPAPLLEPEPQIHKCNWALMLLGGVTAGLFLWVLILTVTVMKTTPSPPPAPTTKNTHELVHLFNLIANDSTNQWMDITIASLNVNLLIRYDICCMVSAKQSYMCRSLARNMGVDGYAVLPNRVMIQISHPAMVGSVCKFIWSEQA